MRRAAAILAALALATAAALALTRAGPPGALLHGWLFAAHAAMALSLGASVLLLIHAITGGRWGQALGPALRAAAAATPVGVIAFVPLLLAAGELYPWAGEPPEALEETVAKKLLYLEVGFLQLRSVAVLALFLAAAWLAGAWSRRTPAMFAAAAMLALLGFGVSIFAVDWLLAFEPTFYSTIYPPLHAVASLLAALAFATLALWAGGGDRERLRTCGMLLLGWAMVWLYMAFMQYLIIWSGDLPPEIAWYLARLDGGWRPVLWLALACHVAAVAAMASPRLKGRPGHVAAAAAALLVGQAADLWWRIAPAFAERVAPAHLADLAALAALGGLWLAAAFAMGERPIAREASHG